MNEGESRRIVLKARDPDGDPIRFQIPDLDSLRSIFPANSIQVAADGDSLVLDFSPHSTKGNFRFRIALLDPFLPPVIQTLTLSVGAVNRPPSVVIQGAGPGANILMKEGETLSLRIVAQDSDSGDTAVLLALANPPWPSCGKGSYDTASGTLSFTPSFQCVVAGETTFSDWIFTAMDKGEPPELGRKTIYVTVRDSNSAPKWKSASVPVSGKEGKPMSLDLSAIYLGDDEADSVQFASTCGSVDANTFYWTFTPGFRDAGTMDCEIAATDVHGPPAMAKVVLKLTIADSIRTVDIAIVSPVRGSVTRDSLVIVKWKVDDLTQSQDTLEVLHNEGPNLIRRSYRDSLGRVGTDSIVVYLDTESPLAPVFSTDSVPPTNNPRPTWSWKSGGRGGSGSYRIKLDDTTWATGGQQGVFTTFTPSVDLPEGVHRLYVEERDSAGNWSNPGSFSIETDYTPPSAPVLTSTAFHTLNPKPVWQWSSGGKGGIGTYRIKLDDPNFGIGATITGATSYTPSIGFATGTKHTLYLQERDEAGNWSNSTSFGIRVHGQSGFVVGDSGTIMLTKNAGVNWDTVPRLSKSYLKSAWFLDANTGLIAGDNGKILRTIVGGTRWSPVNSGTLATISSLCFVSDRLGYAATEDGEIRISSDGGETWTLVSTPSSDGISSISFVDSLNGLAVGGFAFGARGFILSTKDGGKTWTKPVIDAPYGLLGITHIGPKRAFAVGNSGAILVSSDSGLTWKEVASGTTNYLTSVFFVSETTGFIAGDQGTILKTIDGGKSWISLATGTQAWLSSAYFTDEKTGYVSGSESTILRTTDGGANWSILTHLITYGSSTSGNINWTADPMLASIYFP